MPVYKVSLIWNHSVMGVSETYYTKQLNVVDAPTYLVTMLNARAAMMFPDDYIVGVRVGVVPAIRQSTVLLPGLNFATIFGAVALIPTNGTATASVAQPTESQLRQTLEVKLGYGGGYTTTRYISGIPREIAFTEPATLDFAKAGTWFRAFNAFSAILSKQGWQIMARTPATTQTSTPIIGLVSQASGPSLLGIVVPGTPTPAFAQGQRVQLTGFRPAKFTRGPTVNGMWTVSSVNATLIPNAVVVYLLGSATIDPTTVRFLTQSRISIVQFGLVGIDSFVPYRIGVHKRGRPSLAPRGRRLSRPTLDP